MSGHGGHEHLDDGDNFGKFLGVATAVLGLCVVVSTIMAHKSHTASLTHKADASDTWNYYQAKKNRGYESGLTATLLQKLTPKDEKETQQEARNLLDKQKEYKADADQLEAKARSYEHLSHVEHTKGDWLDLAEGLFELGVILCSLYFLSKKKLFPLMGFMAAALALVAFGWAFAGPLVMPEHEEAHGDNAPKAQAAPADAHPAH